MGAFGDAHQAVALIAQGIQMIEKLHAIFGINLRIVQDGIKIMQQQHNPFALCALFQGCQHLRQTRSNSQFGSKPRHFGRDAEIQAKDGNKPTDLSPL